MCSPTLAISAVSTAFSAYQKVSQSRAQAAAVKAQARDNQIIADYNATIAENNAEINRRAATDAVQRGANEAAEYRDRIRKINAQGRAARGSSGLLTDSGNFEDLLQSNDAFGELNALTILNNAEREAYGFRVAENSDIARAATIRAGAQSQSNAADASASNIKQAGLVRAGGTLVTGAADFGNVFDFGSGAKRTDIGGGESILWNTDRKGRRF